MRPLSLIATLLCSSVLLTATPVDELLAQLHRCTGSNAVNARITHSFTRVNGEGAEARTDEGEISLTAQASAQGLTISWDAEQFLKPAVEKPGDASTAPVPDAEGKSKAPATASSTKKRSLGAISPGTVSEYLNVAAPFEGRLKDAVVLEDKSDTYDGKAARLLVLRLDPHLKPHDKKYIKQLDAQARIWLDAEGFPIAAETTMSLKGRAMLVITFEQTEKEVYRFARVGERLLVTYREKTARGSGAGEKGSSQEVTRLELL